MRPPKMVGLLATALLFVGSACGTEASPPLVRAASGAAPRELTPAEATTTTTAPPPPPTTMVRPPVTTPRPVVQRPTRAKPAPAPVAAPAPTGGCLRHGAKSTAEAHACWDGLIGQYSWNTTTAFRIMMCESKGDPWARNRSSSATGLMQILGGPTDPAANMALAFQMYSKRGWQPWVCK